MLRNTKPRAIATIAVAFLAPQYHAAAHHSFAAAVDENGNEVIAVRDGTIELYRLLNPHTAIIVNAASPDGEREDWLIEMSSLASLVREGWTEDALSAGDKVTVAVLQSLADYRGRLRAVLVHPTEGAPGRLLVAYGIRGDTPVMRRLAERLPVCGTIDASLGRSQCFLVESEALSALEAEFPGHMGYVLP